MQKLYFKHFHFVLLSYLIWRIFLFGVIWVVLTYFAPDPHSNFLGGGYLNYIRHPYLFSFSNFDGEHYLAIAIFGYKKLEQAFFPLYPLLINITSRWFWSDLSSAWEISAIFALLISNLFFLLSLVILKRLVEIDYSEKISKLTVLLLLSFPTSFFFGNVYSESLFLFLITLSFYLLRNSNLLASSIGGAVSSATRVLGIFLLPSFIVELYLQRKLNKLFFLLFIPIGLLSYMYYQYMLTGDPLAFYHLQTTIGEQRQSNLILLPQVLFRYIRIFLNSDIQNPIYQTVVLEFLSTVLFLTLLIYGFFKKIRLSYLVFGLCCLLISPLQGSLTSMPRYVLVIFPGFLALAIYLQNRRNLLYIIYPIFLIALVWELSLYLRGIWVA